MNFDLNKNIHIMNQSSHKAWKLLISNLWRKDPIIEKSKKFEIVCSSFLFFFFELLKSILKKKCWS